MNKKIEALAKHLEVEPSELSESRHDSNLIEYGREEFLVLDDMESDQRTTEYILESLWAFRPEFLASHLKKGIDQEVVELIQSNGKCESNNSAIESLIEDMEHLIDDAIRSDGRGHFLASYDGNEIELEGGLFAYRVN